MWTMALAVFAGFTSCSDDDTIDRNYGVNNDEVYFPNTLPKTVELSLNASTFEVELRRVRTADAITVPIQATDESGLFSVPANVSFGQGEDIAVLSIGYNIGDITPGTFHTIVLKIADESFTSPYGASSYTFEARLKEQWNQIATGTYTYAQLWNGEDEGLALFRNQTDPTRFKITDWGYGVDFFFTMANDGSVMVDDQSTGYVNPNYGEVYVDDLVDYTEGTGYGVSSYADGVFTFNVIYYCEAGIFGYGPETFTITSTAQAPAKRAPVAVNSSKKVVSWMDGITKRQMMHNSFPVKEAIRQ